ncbi:MAG: hypothetical protein Q9225_003955 [Loekoesia sp. 1 TL-2023]
MASQSPEIDGKKRKPLLDTKRDPRQPRVPSRRYPLSQQAPMFETESLLNTSNVQSPSPNKPTSRPASRTQSRQAFNSGRSLASTYAATPRKKDENKPPLSTGSSPRTSRHTPLKPRPTQTPRSTPSSANKGQDSNNASRLKTPSPARGRQNSVASPSSSASSPPRGLAEAYQRIVDEENLAHEESIEETAEDMDSPSPSEQVQDHGRREYESTEGNESPTSLKASRRAILQSVPEERNPSKPSFREIYEILGDVENDTISSMPDSAHGESPIGEDSQHAKDLRRMNGALRSEPQIFRKALVGNRAGLTVENLRRNNEDRNSVGSSLGGSVSSGGSDPSINVPRQWGRKARPGKDWLSRINSKSGRLTGDVPRRRILDDTGLSASEERNVGNKLAAAAAEVPLPQGDDVSSQTASSRSSTPTTAALRSKSHDRVLEWEFQDEDFTGRSLQISDSPPIRVRNATLDKILEQEISTVAKRAVTTSRLGELREKSSAEQLGRRSLSHSQERSQGQNGGIHQEKGRSQDSEAVPRQPTSNGLQTPSKAAEPLGHGEPVPNTPVVIYRSDSSSSRANDESFDGEEIQPWTAQRPKHGRQDSHDLLRKLARATSASPSPSRDDVGGMTNYQRSDHDRESDDKAERSPPRSKKDEHSTPQPPKSNAYLKTPMVTGAWLDTPLPTGGRGPPMPTPDTDDNESKTLRSNSQKIASGDLIRKLSPHTTRPKIPDEELKKTAPRLPKSALESIINAAKSKAQGIDRFPSSTEPEEDPTLLLGDSTIHSLEELVVTDTDVPPILQPSPIVLENYATSTAPGGSIPLETAPEDGEDDPSSFLNNTDRPRLTELQVYTRQLSRLSNLVPSLRETKKGLASLERAVSAPASPNRSKALTRQPNRAQRNFSKKDKECTEAGEFHDFIWPCERCGCPGALSRASPQDAKGYDYDIDLARISIPVPRLWRWRQNSWWPRLTWPGFFVLTFWLLWLGEMWARERYCHKRFAATMVGYGVDINAPEPPFVLAKVIWRKLGIGLIYDVVRFWAGVFGWFAGFGGAGTGRAREPVSRDERIPKPEWGPDLSMMDDEYL